MRLYFISDSMVAFDSVVTSVIATVAASTIAASDIQPELRRHMKCTHAMLCFYSSLQLYIRIPFCNEKTRPRPTDRSYPKLNDEVSQLHVVAIVASIVTAIVVADFAAIDSVDT